MVLKSPYLRNFLRGSGWIQQCKQLPKRPAFLAPGTGHEKGTPFSVAGYPRKNLAQKETLQLQLEHKVVQGMHEIFESIPTSIYHFDLCTVVKWQVNLSRMAGISRSEGIKKILNCCGFAFLTPWLVLTWVDGLCVQFCSFSKSFMETTHVKFVTPTDEGLGGFPTAIRDGHQENLRAYSHVHNCACKWDAWSGKGWWFQSRLICKHGKNLEVGENSSNFLFKHP